MDGPTWTPEGWVWIENSHNAQNGDDVVTNSVLNNATTTEGPDKWGGFFKEFGIGEMVKAGFAYALQKDAVTSGVTPKVTAVTSTGQPIYQTVPTAQPVNMNLLLIVGIVVAGVLALKKD